MPDAALSGIELYQDVKDPNKRWAALSEFEKGLQGQYTLTPEQFKGLEAAGAKVQRVFNDPMYYNKGAFTDDILRGYQGLTPRAETDMTKLSRGISEKYLAGLAPQNFASTDLALNPGEQQKLAAGAFGGALNPISSGQAPAAGVAYTPEQQMAASQTAQKLYPQLAANPSLGYNIPNVIPQAKVEGQYLYASDVLDKKANNAAVNALYNAYFNRNATAAELKNWGDTGGKDTTVRTLEDFLKQERIKYGVQDPIGELGKIKQVKITPTKGTTETIGSGKTGSDVAKALEENIASAPKAATGSLLSKLEGYITSNQELMKEIAGYMKPTQEEKDWKQAYINTTERISGQPIQMAFIRGQQAVQDRKYQAQLALLQGERKDKLDAAKFLYDANRNNLSDTISLYKSTAPENIGTHIDEATGTMYVVTKNPLTGEVSTMNAGNVGAGKKYTSTSIQTDPVTNQMLFVGVKPDGSIETKALTQGGEKPLSSADRLKYAQDIVTNSGYTVTMEDALKQIDQAQGAVSAGTSGNRPDRNNNPLNIKVPAAGLEEAVRRYGDSGVSIDPVPATDGGYFLKFSSPESGMRAAETLLSSSVYSGLSVDVAMRKWSGGGYGAEVSPSIPATATIGSLSPSQRHQLVSDMAKREGFTGSIGTGSTGAPAQILDKSPYQNAAQILRASLPEAQSKQVGISLNQALNTGNADQAKSVILSAAITALPADQQNKAFGRAVAIDELSVIQKALDEFIANGGNTGLIEGTVDGIAKRIGKTSNPKLTAIGNQIQAAIVAYRSAVSGAAFTESEKDQYEGMFPSTGNTPELNQALISSLSDTFRRNQDSVLSQKIGAENYKKIFGAPETTQTPTATAASDILSEFGVKVEEAKPQTQGGGLSKWWDYFFGGK